MKWIKDQLVTWQLQRKSNLIAKSETIFPMAIQQIGIVAESQGEFEAAKEVIRERWGLKVRIIAHFFTNENSSLKEAVNPTHFTWSGLPSDYFNEFLDESMDFILVSSTELSPYMRYLLLTKTDSFKIGFHSKTNQSYLNLMLTYDEEKDHMENLKLLISYLLKIKEAC